MQTLAPTSSLSSILSVLLEPEWWAKVKHKPVLKLSTGLWHHLAGGMEFDNPSPGGHSIKAKNTRVPARAGRLNRDSKLPFQNAVATSPAVTAITRICLKVNPAL